LEERRDLLRGREGTVSLAQNYYMRSQVSMVEVSPLQSIVEDDSIDYQKALGPGIFGY